MTVKTMIPLSSQAKYYLEKYGEMAIENLEKDALFCETKGDLPRRNRLLRLRDEILLTAKA
jgi:hypothetical protein